MAPRPYPFAIDSAARKWRDLAERRRDHLVELYRSGRWQHYYTDQEFVAEMRQAVALAERWAALAPGQDDMLRQAAE